VCLLVACKQALIDPFISVFRTSHRDPTINETSSYVDLAPLYGNNQQDQDKIRIRNGRGLIAPDTFCEDRLLLLPPSVSTLLVLFNRNHNVSIAPMYSALSTAKFFLDSISPQSFWKSMKEALTWTRPPFQEMIQFQKRNLLYRRRIFSRPPGLSTVDGSPWVRYDILRV